MKTNTTNISYKNIILLIILIATLFSLWFFLIRPDSDLNLIEVNKEEILTEGQKEDINQENNQLIQEIKQLEDELLREKYNSNKKLENLNNKLQLAETKYVEYTEKRKQDETNELQEYETIIYNYSIKSFHEHYDDLSNYFKSNL